jgi:hypothetical protein
MILSLNGAGNGSITVKALGRRPPSGRRPLPRRSALEGSGLRLP